MSKILKPNLTSASNYTFEAKRLASSSGAADAGAALYAASSENNAITSITIDTVDADIVHTVRFVRVSDKKKLHEHSFKHSKVANKKTKLLTVTFQSVPGNTIVTEDVTLQLREFATYVCSIGENALPTATQIELSVSGGHGADPGTMSVMGLSQPVSLTFSGNGQIEWKFPVQNATVSVNTVNSQSKTTVDAAMVTAFGNTPAAIYGSNPYASIADLSAFMALVDPAWIGNDGTFLGFAYCMQCLLAKYGVTIEEFFNSVEGLAAYGATPLIAPPGEPADAITAAYATCGL